MILVTGAAGFIGSHFLELLQARGIACWGIDSLTYAADREFYHSHRDTISQVDITDAESIGYLIRSKNIRAIVNFAAETHVDNSIRDWRAFVHANVTGTATLLEAAVDYKIDRFLHVSTDEVFGSIDQGRFTETLKYQPRNPYSATKAASDHLVSAWHATYGLDTVITNCANNYGPRQHREKLIPKTITELRANRPVPLYGDGLQIRDWIYVVDHCQAVLRALEQGTAGESYCIGSDNETTNRELVETICDLLDKPRSLITHVEDRPGHDRRYATDSSKIQKLGWRPEVTLAQGLELTIDSYSRQRAE